MARTEAEALQKCPVCLTDVSQLDLGLRDFRKLNTNLPGKVGGMDIDFVLEQSSTDRLLALEYKPTKAPLPAGQRRTLHWLKRHGADIWVVVDGKYKDLGVVEVSIMEADGFFRKWHGPMRGDTLMRGIAEWWEMGVRG